MKLSATAIFLCSLIMGASVVKCRPVPYDVLRIVNSFHRDDNVAVEAGVLTEIKGEPCYMTTEEEEAIPFLPSVQEDPHYLHPQEEITIKAIIAENANENLHFMSDGSWKPI